MSLRTHRARGDDEGAVLILALVVIIICALIVIPLLNYTMTVTHGTRLLKSKTSRNEAVKAGLRVALADPKGLYQYCGDSGIGYVKPITSPATDVPVTTTCSKIKDSTSTDPSNLRYGFAAVQVGATNPPVVRGTPYLPSGQSPETNWQADSDPVAQPNKVFLPQLPVSGTATRASTPYDMASGYPACKVYFPGKYPNPIDISGTTPVFFTSGVYYITNPITISGNAKVTFGDGENLPCFNGTDWVSDQDAAFNAINAPKIHGISGLGVTLVIGGQGSLVVNNSTSGSALSVVFNKRYPNPIDKGTLVSKAVSIVSVNGQMDASDTMILPYQEPGLLVVPAAKIWDAGNPLGVVPSQQVYRPSLLTPARAPAPPAPAPSPIVDINLTTASPATVIIPDYISVPQGSVRIAVNPAMTAGKTVKMTGGVLTGSLIATSPGPAVSEIGMVTATTQRTLKITSTTTSGTPKLTSIGIVQVGSNGAWAINSWSVVPD